MQVGDLVVDPLDITASGLLAVGIIIETGLLAIDDTRFEYEEKDVVRVSWSTGIFEHFADDVNTIRGFGSLAELVDALDLGSSILGCSGSTPGGPTIGNIK